LENVAGIRPMAMRPVSIAATTSTTTVIGRRRAKDTKFHFSVLLPDGSALRDTSVL